MGNFFVPMQAVQDELMVELKRLFPAHFADTNIYSSGKTQINYSNSNGEIGALVTMHWQRRPDYKTGSETAVFTHKQRRGDTGWEGYWYNDRRHGD